MPPQPPSPPLSLALPLTAAAGRYFHSLPAAISITNVTEAGTVYSAEEMAAIGAVAKRHGLVLHLDGARFGNAVAAVRHTNHAASAWPWSVAERWC